jgi:non-canonical purine NTP pyrophosphatase (RdgB/HAM1 family)
MRIGLPVVLATGNAGKVREFARLFADAFAAQPLPQGVELPSETGESFAANARLKADHVFGALGGMQAVLADDSGLEVAALGGRPGIFSARYAGERAGDADNVAKLLAELESSPDRSARFVCALCLVLPVDSAIGSRDRCTVVEVEGVTRGSITRAPRGVDGFGYDPVFQPDGWELTLAEASPQAKDGVSHRGAAARALLECLGQLGGE